MKSQFSTANAELIAIASLLISLVAMLSVMFVAIGKSSEVAAWVQAIGSVLAIVAAVCIARRESIERDQREQDRLHVVKRALAIQMQQEVQQKKELMSRQLEEEVFPNSIRFRWDIPTFLEHGQSFKEYIELGDEFLSIAIKLRQLDKEKQDHSRDLTREAEVFASQAETAWRKRHVAEVVQELSKLDAFISSVLDSK